MRRKLFRSTDWYLNDARIILVSELSSYTPNRDFFSKTKSYPTGKNLRVGAYQLPDYIKEVVN